jgi:hypothetical protein
MALETKCGGCGARYQAKAELAGTLHDCQDRLDASHYFVAAKTALDEATRKAVEADTNVQAMHLVAKTAKAQFDRDQITYKEHPTIISSS